MDDIAIIVGLIAGVTWIGLLFLVGWVADRRGHSGLLWFTLAMLLTPFVAGLLLVALAPRRPDRFV
jgi:MFS family permease